MAGEGKLRFTEHEVPRIVYLDADGARWQVREVDARDVPGARGERCLLFEGEGVVRRVWSWTGGGCGVTPVPVGSVMEGSMKVWPRETARMALIN